MRSKCKLTNDQAFVTQQQWAGLTRRSRQSMQLVDLSPRTARSPSGCDGGWMSRGRCVGQSGLGPSLGSSLRLASADASWQRSCNDCRNEAAMRIAKQTRGAETEQSSVRSAQFVHCCGKYTAMLTIVRFYWSPEGKFRCHFKNYINSLKHQNRTNPEFTKYNNNTGLHPLHSASWFLHQAQFFTHFHSE